MHFLLAKKKKTSYKCGNLFKAKEEKYETELKNLLEKINAINETLK